MGVSPSRRLKSASLKKGRRRPTLIKPGVEGAQPPPRGYGGCAPKIPKKGKIANSCHHATSGTRNAGEHSAYEGGQTGVQGGEAPMAGGCGGCPPMKP